jgi:hypothetical protein
MDLTTPRVRELLLSARRAVGDQSALALDRELLAAFALRGKRGLTDAEAEGLVRFVNRIAVDLTLLELLETGEVDFEEAQDGRLQWRASGGQK